MKWNIAHLSLLAVLLTSPLFLFLHSSRTAVIANNGKLLGVMVSRSDHWVLRQWLATFAHEFQLLVILDGSDARHQGDVLKAARRHSNVLYFHESHFVNDSRIAKKTDNSLRGVAFDELAKHVPTLGRWVVIAHSDEYYVQSFWDVAKAAEAQAANVVNFYVWYAVPYIDDTALLEEGIRHGPERFNIVERVRYCFREADHYFLEARMFKHVSLNVRWGTSHSLTVPEHFPGRKDWSYNPRYVHYKVHAFDNDTIDPKTGAFQNSAWSNIGGMQNRSSTGPVHMYSILASGNGVLCSRLVQQYCSTQQLVNCDKQFVKIYSS